MMWEVDVVFILRGFVWGFIVRVGVVWVVIGSGSSSGYAI
jgi:hypothetical protein